MSEQVDIAVDLGVVAAPLPEIMSLRQLVETAPDAPPQIIEGVLHQGCKMILGGTSKSNKSWCLLDLAVELLRGRGKLTISEQDLTSGSRFPRVVSVRFLVTSPRFSGTYAVIC